MNHVYMKRANIDMHFIKEKLNQGLIFMTYVPNNEQRTELLTNGPQRPQFKELTNKLGMRNLHGPSSRES